MYRSADDYLNLRPSDTQVLFQYAPEIEGDGRYNFYSIKQNGKRGDRRPPEEYFAGSDGKTFYIAHDGKWHKTKKVEGEYYYIFHVSRMYSAPLPGRVYFGVNGSTMVFGPQFYYRMKFSPERKDWIVAEQSKKPIKL
jgi:hypothetical protein